MALDQTANFVRGTVSAAVGSGDTTISVTDASIFPDPSTGEYNLVLWDTAQGRPDQDGAVEVVRVTGRDATNDTLTVTRGQEGTSDASHPDSSSLLLDATDKLFSEIDTIIEDIADTTASPTELTAPVNNSEVTTDEQTINPARIYPDETDDPQTVINNAPTGAEIHFDSSVNYTLNSTLDVQTADVTIKNLHVTLANGVDDRPVLVDGADGVEFYFCVIDGNKSNQTSSGPSGAKGGIVYLSSPEDPKLIGCEIRNILEGAGLVLGARTIRPIVRNCYVHDCGTGTASCDGIFNRSDDSRIHNNLVKNITDALIANDACRRADVSNNICYVTSTYITNNQAPQGGITAYANVSDWTGTIANNVVSLADDDAPAISDVESTSNDLTATIDGNVVEAGDVAIRMDRNATDVALSDNIIHGVGGGILVGAGCTLRGGRVSRDGTGRGVEVKNGSPTVDGVDIDNCGIGISVQGGTPKLRNNTITGVNNGIIEEGYTTTAGVLIGNEVDAGTTDYSLSNISDFTIAANDPRVTVASGTVTLTGGDGNDTAQVGFIGTLPNELAEVEFIAYLDSAPSFSADYGWYPIRLERDWDDSDSEYDLRAVASWSVDPGSGNDVTVRFDVLSE